MTLQALPEMVAEQELLAGCRSGSEDAFDDLFRAYAAPLRAFCRSRLSDGAEVEDACQETMLRAYNRLATFHTGKPLWPWLATIAANVCIDMHRKARLVPLSDDELAEHMPGDAQDLVDPHEHAVRNQRHAVLTEAMEGVPLQHRHRIYLRELEGWSYQEIADLQHTTVDAVRSSLVRGRHILRKRLQELAAAGRLGVLPVFAPIGWASRQSRQLARRFEAAAVRAGENVSSWASLGLPSLAQATAAVAMGITVTATVMAPTAAAGDAARPAGDTVTVERADDLHMIAAAVRAGVIDPIVSKPAAPRGSGDEESGQDEAGANASPSERDEAATSPSTNPPVVNVPVTSDAPAAPSTRTSGPQLQTGDDGHTVDGPVVTIEPSDDTEAIPEVDADTAGVWCPPPDERSPTMTVVCAPLDEGSNTATAITA